MSGRAALVDRYRTRNLAVSVSNEMAMGTAVAFVHSATILPVFLAELGASPQIIALIPTITAVFYAIPQLLFAHRTAHVERKRVLLVILHAPVIFGFFLLFAGFYYLPLVPRQGIRIFFIAYMMYNVGLGCVIPIWSDFTARITNPRWRGRYVGITLALHCVGSVFGALWAKRLIEGHAFPKGFALGFLAATILAAIAALPFLFSKEILDEDCRDQTSWRQFMSELWKIIRTDWNFMRYITAKSFLYFGLIGLAFFAVYARTKTGFALGEVGVLAAVVVAAEGVSFLACGWIGDRIGFRLVVIGTHLILLAATVAAIGMSSLAGFYVIFVAIGLYRGSEWMGNMTMVFDICPRIEKSVYFALANTLIAIPAIVVPAIGGAVATWISYEAAFLVSALGLMVGILLLRYWVRDPGHKRT